MKHALTILILLIFVSCQTEKPKEVANNSFTIQDSLALLHILQNEWPKAYREQDTLLIKKILADNFEVIFDSGAWSDKQGEVKWIAENKTTTDSLYRDIKRFEFLGNETAIVAGTGHVYNDGKHSSYEFTDVFIKKGAAWQATASHVSGVKEID